MKIYVNFEGIEGEDGLGHCYLWKRRSGDDFSGVTFQDVLLHFVLSFREKHAEAAALLAETQMGLLDSYGLPLDLEGSPSQEDDGCDLTVALRKGGRGKGKARHWKRVADLTAASSLRRGSQASAAATAATAAAVGSGPAPVATVPAGEVVPALKRAAVLAKDKHFQRARQLWRGVLRVEPTNKTALRGLASLSFANERWDEAVDYLQRLGADKRDAKGEDLLLLGRCLLKQDEPEEAQLVLSKALPKAGGRLKDDVEVALGWCAMGLNDAATANTLFHTVATRTNEAHVGALVGYSSLAVLVNQPGSAISPLLKAMVIDQKDKETGRLLAKVLSSEGGLTLLKEQLPKEATNAQVYGFLATTVKDHGAIDASVQLLEQALRMAPLSASYALNLVHAHELCHAYPKALKAGKAFLAANRGLKVGRSSKALRMELVLHVLDKITDPAVAVPAEAQYRVRWVEEEGQGMEWRAPQEGEARDEELARSYAKVVKWEEGDSEEAWAAAEVDKRSEQGVEEYDAQALDLLALCFTCVKILYLRGALAVLPSLIRLIEPARLRSKVPLHKTTIRNEQAYYTCVAQLLSIRMEGASDNPSDHPSDEPSDEPQQVGRTLLPLEPQGNSGASPIYVCGDSHTLPAVWQSVSVKGQQRLLYPALVTGLKHWHLRPESSFYPKANFFRTVASFPVGATVMFMFGEIDCREGILLAVDRCRYESVEEGMRATVRIFIEVAKDLVKTKKLTCFVHPVAPVLDETRPLVRAYNAILEEEVRATKGLRWLDLFDDLLLLTDGGGGAVKAALRPGLALDGAHLHPRYVKYLVQALNKAA